MDKEMENKLKAVYFDVIQRVHEEESNERLRAVVQEFIDDTTAVNGATPYIKFIWMQAALNHIALQCRNFSLQEKTQMLDDFRKLLFAK